MKNDLDITLRTCRIRRVVIICRATCDLETRTATTSPQTTFERYEKSVIEVRACRIKRKK